MNRKNIHRSPRHGGGLRQLVPARTTAVRSQRGVALVVSMLLLIIVALVGLAAVRGTTMQQKMASNLYDREQALQAAEAAMRVATAVLPNRPDLIARNCQIGGTVCLANPFTDPNVQTKFIQTVASTAFNPGPVAAAQPQYVIENMGNYVDPASASSGDSANCVQYGAQGCSSFFIYYRVTARSGDPAKVGDRAVVTLQATIKQG